MNIARRGLYYKKNISSSVGVIHDEQSLKGAVLQEEYLPRET
jgi:hypothetical protein